MGPETLMSQVLNHAKFLNYKGELVKIVAKIEEDVYLIAKIVCLLPFDSHSIIIVVVNKPLNAIIM